MLPDFFSCCLFGGGRRLRRCCRNQHRRLIEFDLIEILGPTWRRRVDNEAERRPDIHHFIVRLYFTETKRRLRIGHSCPRSPISWTFEGKHFVGTGHWPPTDSTLSPRDRLVVDRASRAVEEIGLPRQGHLL